MAEFEVNIKGVGKRLKTVRKKMHLTIRNVATIMWVGLKDVSDIENGKMEPDPKYVLRFASVLNVNLNFLFMGIGKIFIDDDGTEMESDFNIFEKAQSIEDLNWLFTRSNLMVKLVMDFVNEKLITERSDIALSIKNKVEAEKARNELFRNKLNKTARKD